MAFRRRTAVLNIIGLLSGLVAMTAAGAAGPSAGSLPAEPPSPTPATADPGHSALAALVQPEAALPGPLPVDGPAALASAVAALAGGVSIAVDPVEEIRGAQLPPGLAGRLALLLNQLQACQAITDRLIAALPAAPGVLLAQGHQPGPIPEAPALLRCAASVQAGGLELERFLLAAPAAGPGLDLWPVLRVDLDGASDTVIQDYMLSVDVGGDDTYPNNAGGNLIDVRRSPPKAARGCVNPAYDLLAGECVISQALLVDLEGDDTYGHMEPPEEGLDGLCTDDPLVRRIMTGGVGSWGVGVLIDRGGDDHYLGKSIALGAGHFGGTGVLFDEGGNDHYSAMRLAKGFGTLVGTGVLHDGAGDDIYTYYLPRPLYPDAADRTLGAGGALDTGGTCDRIPRWDEGSGFLGGFGVFVDDAGDDTYEAASPLKHEPGASGMIRDTGSLGFGDGGFGIFVDGAGHDRYSGMPGRADGATVGPSGTSQGFFHDEVGRGSLTTAGSGGGGFMTAWFTHYIPETVSVDQGGTLQFFNPDLYGGPLGGRRHSITELRPRTDPGPPRFDVFVPFGEAAPIPGVEGLKPGTYQFFCRVHPFMKGTLIVR